MLPHSKNDLNSLVNKYNQINSNTVLFPAQSGSGVKVATEAEARQWLSELNLPNSCLKSYGSGYVVTVDLTPLQKMVQDIDGLGAPGKIQNSKWITPNIKPGSRVLKRRKKI